MGRGDLKYFSISFVIKIIVNFLYFILINYRPYSLSLLAERVALFPLSPPKGRGLG
jgi:hypothetical protein